MRVKKRFNNLPEDNLDKASQADTPAIAAKRIYREKSNTGTGAIRGTGHHAHGRSDLVVDLRQVARH